MINWKDLVLKKDSGTEKTKCPLCQDQRRNKSDKPVMVYHTSGVAKCFHCEELSFRDDIKKETEKNYVLPVQNWQNHTELSDDMVKWFEARKIQQYTLQALKITQEKQYQPALKKEVNNIVFNYFEGSTVISKKYRSGNKKFTQTAQSRNIFYNINSIIGEKECYIVEGEMDVLAMHQAGYKNVISVPNGANNNDDYWQHAEYYIKDIELFYIAVDNDQKGNELSEKIAQRLGRWRCKRIEFNKDANDDLINNKIDQSIKDAKRYPVGGTFTSLDLLEGVLDLHKNGLPKTLYPKKSRWGNLKDIWQTMKGHLAVVTGIPSHGKSNFVEDYVIDLIDDHDLKASFFSPEHSPMALHKTTFIQKAIGRNFWSEMEGLPRITTSDIFRYTEWSKEKIYLTDTEKGEYPTWDWLFKKFKEQMYSFGIDIFVIDAFNKVLLPKGNKIEAINEVLTKLTSFAQSNNVLVFLVAHPTKMTKKDDGTYAIPDLYNVSGSADFRNQTHDGFTIHRYFDNKETGETGSTEFHNTKVKMNFQGKIGEKTEFKYHIPSGRYYIGEKPIYDITGGEKIEPATTDEAFESEVPF